MTATLGSNSLAFPTSTIYDGDLQAMKTVYSPVDYGVAFSTSYSWYTNEYQQSRYGTMYVTRGFYSTNAARDSYGNPIAGLGYPTQGSISSAYDTITYANTSQNRSVVIRIEAYAANPISIFSNGTNLSRCGPSALGGRGTDDIDYHTVYRGGSPVNQTSHSGGTALVSGWAGYWTYNDTIPPNTTYTYWHYAALSGSGGDTLATRFFATFVNFA
jgi:hypothetical protein